jgi:hypothetical protein
VEQRLNEDMKMKVRELLQIEIWSKETSRKILDSIRKILFWVFPSKKTFKRIGIVLGILIVVLGVILAIEIIWLTSGERKVASTTLAKIDSMQNLVTTSSNDFEAMDQQAKEMVEEADHVAWTIRDKGVAFNLSFYLSETEQARHETEFRAWIQQRKIHRSDRSLEDDKESDALNLQIRNEFRSAVVKWLQ